MAVVTDSAPSSAGTAGDVEMAAVNRAFYDALWRDCRLQQPERFNTWPEVARLAAVAADRLEVGPGLR
nr:SAM-dependent methyltransferase [Planctomycetota bacterium]